MLRSADRKILTEQAYSAQRSYGVSGARRAARLRVRLFTTDWTTVIDAGCHAASGPAGATRPTLTGGWVSERATRAGLGSSTDAIAALRERPFSRQFLACNGADQ